MTIYVYNDDGTQPMNNVRLGRVRECLEEWIDWILDTPVETYVGCTAHPEIICHNARAGELFGARSGLKLNASQWLRKEAHAELIRQGTDQLRVLSERAHSRSKLFLAGIRMSDAHHRSTEGVEPHEYPLFPQFTLAHPEWRIRNADGSMDVTMDYSFEGVRAHRLAILREIMRDYDVDGLELDFMRFCCHFSRPATLEQVEIMNEFMRCIRRMMDEEWKSRGRPGRPVLGVRLPPTLAECAPNGLDPEQWIRNGLIDYQGPADFLWADFNIPLSDYLGIARGSNCRTRRPCRHAARGSNCRTLFSIQPWVASSWENEMRPYNKAFTMRMPEFRALAANGFAAGADGLHCFNLCCELPGRKDEIVEALSAMKNFDSVFSGPRHYQFFPSTAGDTITGARSRQTLCFPAPDKPSVFRFQLADGRLGGSGKGRVAWRIYESAPTDEWMFRLNGIPLDREKIRIETRYSGHPVRVGAELPRHIYFEMDLKDVPALEFINEIEITPVRLEPEVLPQRKMEVLEAWIGI